MCIKSLNLGNNKNTNVSSPYIWPKADLNSSAFLFISLNISDKKNIK